MSHHSPVCSRCGGVDVGGGASVEVASGGSSPGVGPIPLCGRCLGRLLRWLGPQGPIPAGPRKTVVDPCGFQAPERMRGKLRHVAALEALMNRDIDLRRVVDLGRTINGKGTIRVFMAIYASAVNTRQACSISGEDPGHVTAALAAMVKLGLAEDVGRTRENRVYEITPKGRRFFEEVIEAASESGGLKLLRDVVQPGGMRLIGERRAAVSASGDAP